jgi:hypothetical protein
MELAQKLICFGADGATMF